MSQFGDLMLFNFEKGVVKVVERVEGDAMLGDKSEEGVGRIVE